MKKRKEFEAIIEKYHMEYEKKGENDE